MRGKEKKQSGTVSQEVTKTGDSATPIASLSWMFAETSVAFRSQQVQVNTNITRSYHPLIPQNKKWNGLRTVRSYCQYAAHSYTDVTCADYIPCVHTCSFASHKPSKQMTYHNNRRLSAKLYSVTFSMTHHHRYVMLYLCSLRPHTLTHPI